MSEGRGGHWNRAGRRSGGAPARRLDVVVPETCACGAELYPGLLEQRVIRDGAGERHEIRLCPGCHGVVMSDGQWLAPREEP